eukprot:scaffold262635_cov22-Prasinocladus_malaysianus.AAC.1
MLSLHEEGACAGIGALAVRPIVMGCLSDVHKGFLVWAGWVIVQKRMDIYHHSVDIRPEEGTRVKRNANMHTHSKKAASC